MQMLCKIGEGAEAFGEYSDEVNGAVLNLTPGRGLLLMAVIGTHSYVSDEDNLTIKRLHNLARKNTDPEAANMQYMYYHEGAAAVAQNWANACKRLVHNKPQVKGFKSCGQNLYVSSAKVPWEKAVKRWWEEVQDFTFGGSNNFAATGHYSQMVWAKSNQVGCGYAKCSDRKGVFHNYVCNYCPAGNLRGFQNRPYEVGTLCDRCPDRCHNGLCY
ncbi:cysteine-rich secretory protein 2-like [Neocloeon triangulifer]|uniref:cysteine-rich secretory protein 2-like n=1 Tax=Neocloeon triangulifer TaxID=2078957 RepID=UPI00286F8042|nr:cysteine-rich secretory protein 2-like [Neocloeon triangulifer]